MTMVDTIRQQAVELAKKAPKMAKEQAKEMGKDAVKDAINENGIGLFCIMAIKGEKNQNRCKALTRLYDIAKSGKAAVASCGTAFGAGVAEVGSAGAASPVALPVGAVAGVSCIYNVGSVADSSVAMVGQAVTGNEWKTIKEQVKEKLEDKLGGTWVKEKIKEKIKEKAHEAYDAWKESVTRPPPVYMPMPF